MSDMRVYPPSGVEKHTTNAPTSALSQDYTIEPKAKNVENITKITPEMQLKELCPVWKTSFCPPTSSF